MIEVVNAQEVANRILALSNDLQARARVGLRDGAQYLMDRMKAEKLTGQYINVGKTQRLRNAWQIVDRQANLFGDTVAVAIVNTEPHAAAHEFGVHKAVQVKEHLRSRPKRSAAKAPKSKEGRRRFNAEQAARAKVKARQGWQKERKTRLREVRRERGLQGGIAARASKALMRDAAKAGKIVVRAHGRFMRLKARHFARDSAIQYGPGAIQVMLRTMMKGIR